MQVLVRPAAAADIDDAFLWYEQQRPGFGADFLRTVDGALTAIQSRLTKWLSATRGKSGRAHVATNVSRNDRG